ncbi:unnamed protein product [Prorocentrum cordatum]|uniref:Uncharacterized protein n=1 Tax=Prorocentrum cordatum TaxID=2364126 RepID=A0ABN9TZ46_9DINO|nr:unnamed protein product [Polarella glacialis]
MEAVSSSVRRGALLLSGSQEAWPRTPGAVVAVLAAVLLAVRLSSPPAEAQMAVAGLALAVFVALGCSPRRARARTQVVDQRLEDLEAAFASMLDVLRPLSAHGRAAEAPGRRGRFPVRLVTEAWPGDASEEAERQTLRATLLVPRPGSEAVSVACAAGGFTVRVGAVEGAVPDFLGRNAAGTARRGRASRGAACPSCRGR